MEENCKIITDLMDNEGLFMVKCRGRVSCIQYSGTGDLEKQEGDSTSRFSAALKSKQANKNQTNK